MRVRQRLGHPPKSPHCWAHRVAQEKGPSGPVQSAPNFLLRPRRSYWSYVKDWLSELLLRRRKPGKDFRGRFVVEGKFFGSVGAPKCIGRQCFRDICLMLSLPNSAGDAVIRPKSLRQSFMALQSKGSNLIRCGLEIARIGTAVEVGGDLKSGLGSGGAGIVFALALA